MLRLQAISSPAQSRSTFDQFDPTHTTWLVSDLKSKFELSDCLLQKRPFIVGESVLRANELWRLLLSRVRPDLQIVSREFIVTLLAQRLPDSGLEWAQTPGVASTIFDYMTQLMPVLSHPEGEEMIRGWLEENPASQSRWGRWFDASIRFWREFLSEGFIAPSWASGVLSNEPELLEGWNRDLIVDLGAALDPVEADLLVQLSDKIDVTILEPNPQWRNEHRRALLAYEIFQRKLKFERIETELSGQRSARVDHRKYTTMIAEVKDAVAIARRWLEHNPPASLALVAPDIEAYWPALSSYLAEEGIPVAKDQVRKLQTFPDIAQFLANLRLRTGAFAEADLELAMYDNDNAKPKTLSFERFKNLYSTLYGREDLESRSNEIAARFAVELAADAQPLRDEFVAWSLKQLPEHADHERVQSLFKRLFSESPSSLRLSVSRWLGFLEQIASKTERRFVDGDPAGISCLNISSAQGSKASRMIVLGLSEKALQNNRATAILLADTDDISRQFGFHLSNHGQEQMEFEARWLFEDPERELTLMVAETDFAGAPQAPSWLWIRGARQEQPEPSHQKVFIPSPTRWDELQAASLEDICANRKWSAAHASSLESAMLSDLGQKTLPSFGAGLTQSLSPSAIEDYLKCPFIFAAKRIFRLSDLPELDLDIDPMSRGILMHKIFELLTAEPFRADQSDDELNRLIEAARTELELRFADEGLWASVKASHLDLARRFLAFEKDYRQRFPEVKTVGREIKVKGRIDLRTGELKPDSEPSEGDLLFSGKIDRIDQDSSGNYAIYDYKSSKSSINQFDRWIEKNQIQLLLYAMAVENGLSSLQPSTVACALYITRKPLARDFGYKITDVEQKLFDLNKKQNRLTQAEKDELFALGREKILAAIKGITAGEFAPRPQSLDLCNSDGRVCQWSSLCRAPHLNN